jgi:hypothetical protein
MISKSKQAEMGLLELQTRMLWTCWFARGCQNPRPATDLWALVSVEESCYYHLCIKTSTAVMFWWRPSIDFDWSKITRHETRAWKLEPWHLPVVETCQVLAGSSTHVSMPRQPKPPKHIPIKTCNVLCFGPVRPSSTFPHSIPIHAPWPIHDTLGLFQLHIVVVCFFYGTLTSSWPLTH